MKIKMEEIPYKKRYAPMYNKPNPEMQAILAQLPKSSKDVAESFYFTFDLNIHKVAKRLGITERAVRFRLETANKKLRKLLPFQKNLPNKSS